MKDTSGSICEDASKPVPFQLLLSGILLQNEKETKARW